MLLEEARQRLKLATDAFQRLRGAEYFASRQGDAAWLAEIREQFPAVLVEQRAASDALKTALEAGRGDG